jgi:hypothetical protein
MSWIGETTTTKIKKSGNQTMRKLFSSLLRAYDPTTWVKEVGFATATNKKKCLDRNEWNALSNISSRGSNIRSNSAMTRSPKI